MKNLCLDFVVVFQLVFIPATFGNAVSGCTVKDHLPCVMHKFKASNCSPVILQQKFPDLYNSSAGFPERPGNFSRGELDYVKQLVGTTTYWYPSLNLTWTPPANGEICSTIGAETFSGLKGFELLQYRDGRELPSCFIFDLTNATWKFPEDLETTFKYFLMMTPNKTYRYDLYSLPKLPTEQDQQYLRQNMILPNHQPNITASKWVATIYFQVFDKEGRIHVSFARAPDKFIFHTYRVSLYDTLYDNFAESQDVDQYQTAYNFTQVKKGTYRIEVLPNDPDRNGKCTCVNDDANACPGTCTTTVTQEFTLTHGYRAPTITIPTTKTSTTTISKITIPSTTTSTTMPSTTTSAITSGTDSSVTSKPLQDESAVTIILAVLGSIVGVAIIILILATYFKCRKHTGEDPDENKIPHGFGNVANDNFSVITGDFIGELKNPNDNKVVVKKELEKQPKLFMLYEVDHECHSAVVDNLAIYLQQQCQCKVMHVEWSRDDSWIHQELQQADFVVIVNSEAAYRSYISQGIRQGSRHTSGSSINSVRNKFMQEERYDNVVMVYFEYTSDRFILPGICQGYKYKLMQYFHDFLLHIHRLRRTENLAQYDLPFDGNHRQSEVGQKLLDSITVAAKYELENPKWYQRSCSNEDSQLDFGLTECFNSPGQTPISENSEPWNTNPKQLHLLNHLKQSGHDSITINSEEALSKAEPKCTRNPAALSPLKCLPSVQHTNFSPSPPTASSSGVESIFLPPDDISDFDAISKSQSEQMRNIVERYQNTVSMEPKMAVQQTGCNNGGYDKTTDLDLLEVQSGEILFTSGGNGFESVSLGGESV